MVKNIGAGGKDGPKRLKISPEVGNQHFDQRIGLFFPDRSYSSRKDARPAVGKIVSGNGGYHRVEQSEGSRGLGHPGRFFRVGGPGGWCPTAQKPQLRVQSGPIMRKAAVRAEKHSHWLGQ